MSGNFEQNPFVGPRAIQTGEVLHGRDAELFELYNHLQARRIVVLHSPSGAGKSSLIQAGLIPRLREGGFDVWKPVRVNLDPAELDGVPEACNRYLLSAMISLEDELPAEHRRSPAQLAELEFAAYLDSRPRRKSATPRSVVLIFDQFEEILTVAPRALAAKREFFRELGRALDRSCWALFSLREDYLAALAPYRDLIPTQLSNSFRLDLLGLAGAREAGVALAAAGGRKFTAIDQLVRDLSTVQVQQPDGSFAAEQGVHVEPVQLQVVCRRLWAALPPEATSIEAEDIAAYADVSASLAGYYADTVATIAAGDRMRERTIREWVGQRLIVAGIRSQVRRGVDETAGLAHEGVAALLDSYLIRAEQRAGGTWYELSHDRLIGPIQLDNERWEQAHLHPLQTAARRWEQERRPAALLLAADELGDALAWARSNPDLLTPSEREYLERSRARRRAQVWQRRKRWVWGVAIAAGLLALGVEGHRRYDRRQRTLACEATGVEIEAAWTPARAQALREGLLASGVSYAAVTADKLMPWLDDRAQAWGEARVEACLDAEVRERWDADTYDRSLWCLEVSRLELESLVDEMTKADAMAVQKAVTAVAGLEPIEVCRDAVALARMPAPPVEQREAVRAVQADLTRAGNLERMGRYEDGLDEARGALAQAEVLGWRPLTAAARLRVGISLDRTGAYAEAEAALEQAYFEAAEGVAPGVAFAAARQLVYVVGSELARHADGERWGRHAEVALASLADAEGLRRADLSNDLAIVHNSTGAYAEAKALHERALAIREDALGPEHPHVAVSLNNLAAVHLSTGAYAEAKALQKRTLAIEEDALGPEHPVVADSLNNLAAVHQETGAYAEAKALHERALAIFEHALGPEHPGVASSLGNLAIIHQETGAYAEAKALHERALAIFEHALGPEHPNVASCLNNLAIIHAETGAYTEATALYERALAIREHALGPEHPDVATSLYNLADVHRATGAYAQAKVLYERALALEEHALGPEHPNVAYTLLNLAEVALVQDRAGDAVALATRGLDLFERSEPPAELLAEARFILARALWAAPADAGRDRARALALAEQAREPLRDPGNEDLLAELEAWLAEREGGP